MELTAPLFLALMVANVGDCLEEFGYSAEWRTQEDNVKKAMFIINPTKHFPEDGVLIGWHVYTTRGRRSQVVHLQIFRPLGEHQYILIGQTIFTALWVGHNFVPLFKEDRIMIEKGDVIGIYFPKYNPIPYSNTECKGDNEHEHLFKYNPRGGKIQIDSKIQFDKPHPEWGACRHYSLNATYVLPQDIEQYDSVEHTYENVADNRGPHGRYKPTDRPIAASANHIIPSHHVKTSLASLLAIWIIITRS